MIISSNHDFGTISDALPYGTGYKDTPIIIKDNVWIGMHVVILQGVILAEGTIVGAGSVVTKSSSYCSIVAGNPAKEINKRDIHTYEMLKARQAYLNDIRGFNYYSLIQNAKKYTKLKKLIKHQDVIYDYMLDNFNPKNARRMLYKYAQSNEFFFESDENGFYIRAKY